MKALVGALTSEGPSRGLLRDCTTSPINRFAALVTKKQKANLSSISSAVLGLATVAGVLGQAEYDYTDDFSCPDELEGFYPHLYR